MFKRYSQISATLVALAVADLRGATISWTNTSGGLWSVPANWDAHFVPRPFDAVNVTAVGNYTVTVDTNVTILSLSLGGASGQQTLTNSAQTLSITNTLVAANGIFSFGGGTLTGGLLADQGTFNWGGGTLAVPVTVAAAGTLNVNGTAVILQGPLTNAGTIHWNGGGSSITVYNNQAAYTGAIYNQAGALFDIQSDQSLFSAGYGFEVFQNAGTVRKSAGGGLTSVYVALTNTGLVDAQSGTIQFSGGGNIGGSSMTRLPVLSWPPAMLSSAPPSRRTARSTICSWTART